MDNVFVNSEKLYRAVYPQNVRPNFWKENGQISSAVFKKKDGISVERGYFRTDDEVIEEMKKFFPENSYISVNVGQCKQVDAVVKYLPTARSKYHSEIHGSEERVVLSPSQAKHLAKVAKIEYMLNGCSS